MRMDQCYPRGVDSAKVIEVIKQNPHEVLEHQLSPHGS